MGTREQPSDRDPEAITTAQLYLLVGAVSLTTAALLCAGSYFGFITVGTGVFSILAVLTVAGASGYLVRSAQARVCHALAQAVRQARQEGCWCGYTTAQAEAAAADPVAAMMPPDEVLDLVAAEVRRAMAEDRSAARSAGYAEGYVDGIDRRDGGPSAN